ncbi:MAG: UDP-N-acetylmuramate dehydrogenase [Tannerella sp.]|nr:UDP-N-acetylmuramate dehydrogenase [Tannerella sp.]
MLIEQNFLLEHFNTFNIPAKTRWFMEYGNEEELLRILRDEYFQECLSLHIGEGSNLLFINDFNGVIIHSRIKGVNVVDESSASVLLRVGAGEHWDDVVAFAVSRGWGGIENLSYIPGETGAAAVQNIGAYGAEIKDVVETVEAYNQLTFVKRVFTKDECEYGYRHSYFKEADHDPYIITCVNLRLSKNPVFNLDYGNLREALSGKETTLQTVRDAVIAVRRSKLPEVGELGSTGSFFMNPFIQQSQFAELKNEYPEMPSYPDADGRVKIPAGWLIEKCGFKGKRQGNVGVYEKQALVIVNYGGASGHEIADFAGSIRSAVLEKFGIELIPEVKYVQ